MSDAIRKLVRFAGIYGLRRALFKAAGRVRAGRAAWLAPGSALARRDVGAIGCGQFAFSTIGYVLSRHVRRGFAIHYDPDADAARTFGRFYGSKSARSAAEVIAAPEVQVVYVASNHASHAPYATEALRAGKTVYVEKPISVTEASLHDLVEAESTSPGRLFCGYNRPFSSAIRELRQACGDVTGPLTLSCTVQGHLLPADHWYRAPQEGTRICGNVGHWLDLLVHIASWRGLAEEWTITLDWSDERARDENLSISLTSSRGDLAVIVMTARAEPFEGIAETIVLQWGDVSATIDDFRRMTLHRGVHSRLRRYRPKDVGHIRAINQPFGDQSRDFSEIVRSTRLMLAITDMVRSGVRRQVFRFSGSGPRPTGEAQTVEVCA